MASMTLFNAVIAHPVRSCRPCALIDEGHATDAAEIRDYMSGNRCRCGAYPSIVAAVEAVRDNKEG